MTEDEAESPLAVSAAADGAAVQRSPVIAFLYSSCLGELIKLEGEAQYVRQSVESPGNEGYHVISRMNYNVQGIGLISGARYEIRQQIGFEHDNVTIANGSTETSTMLLNIIKLGSGLVFTVRAVEHLTINAEGALIVELDEFSGSCSN